jgi:hypothetical protein
MKAENVGLKVGGGEVWKNKGFKSRQFTVHPGLDSEEEAKMVLEGLLRKNSFRYQSASGEVEGYNRLYPGMTVMIQVPEYTAGGEYIAERVSHRYETGKGYKTRFVLKRNTQPGTARKESRLEERDQKNSKAVIAEDIKHEEESRNPTLKNLKWLLDESEITEALVDDEVVLSVEVQDIADKETVELEIWENDEDNEHDFVEKVKGKVKGGKVEVPWKVKYMADDDDSTSGQELTEKGYTLPEYHFIAHYKDVESIKSNILEVRGWIKKQILYAGTKQSIANKKYTLYLPDNTKVHGETDSNGFINESGVLLGMIHIDFTEEG